MYNEIKICLQAYTYVLIPRSTKVLRQRYKHVHRREAFNKWRTIQLVLPGVQGQGQGRAGWVISLPMLSSQSMLTLKAFLAKPIWSSLDAAIRIIHMLCRHFLQSIRYSAEKAVVERSVPVGAEGRRGQVRHHLRQLAVPALQGLYLFSCPG